MIAKNDKTKPVRCAIYTRKSHEEGLDQSFNSLDAQREACEAYIASQKHEGWKAITTHYDDGGFTGGNMDRPGLKALLADIEAGGVDVVKGTVTAKPTIRRDGDAIVIDIPMALRHRGGRKEIVLPPGVAPVAESAKSDAPPSALMLALARAFHWQERIESGQAESNSDIARKLGLDQSYVARTTRLTSLATDLIEAILDGNEPDGLSLRTLHRDLPLVWEDQRRALTT